MIANLDLDLVVYMLGSVHDGRHWVYKGQKYTSKRELNVRLKEDGLSTDWPVLTQPSSVSKVKTSVIDYVDSIIGLVDCECIGHISGKANFRHDVATILPYKGNRQEEKPYHYDTIRQLLVDVYDTRVSQGHEADDAIGLNHNPETDVIVTKDKDLDCIPGLHYNWEKDECYYVQEVDANRHFFKQMLTGDTTDNILGLFGVGPKSEVVKKIYKMTEVGDMRDLVLHEYSRRFGDYGPKFYHENAKLLWILQQRECVA